MANPLNNNINFGNQQPNMQNNAQFANNPQVAQIQNVMSQLQNMKNPMEYVQNIFRQNPQLQNMVNMNRNRNPKEFLMELAKNNGATPDTMQFISQLLK